MTSSSASSSKHTTSHFSRSRGSKSSQNVVRETGSRKYVAFYDVIISVVLETRGVTATQCSPGHRLYGCDGFRPRRRGVSRVGCHRTQEIGRPGGRRDVSGVDRSVTRWRRRRRRSFPTKRGPGTPTRLRGNCNKRIGSDFGVRGPNMDWKELKSSSTRLQGNCKKTDVTQTWSFDDSMRCSTWSDPKVEARGPLQNQETTAIKGDGVLTSGVENLIWS